MMEQYPGKHPRKNVSRIPQITEGSQQKLKGMNPPTCIDEMESTQIEVNLLGEAEMGENVVCDDGQD